MAPKEGSTLRERYRKRARRLAFALAMSAVCTPALAAEIPQPIGHPSREEQEVFDSLAKLMPLAHQRAVAIVDQVMADVIKLTARLEPELVNQTVTDRAAALVAQPDSKPEPSDPRWGCPTAVMKLPTRLTAKEAFDALAKKRADSIAGLKAQLIDRFEYFTKLTEQQQKTMLELRGWYERRSDAATLGRLASEMRSLLKWDTTYFQEQYGLAALALLNLWLGEQSEAANAGGGPDYFPLLERMSDEADRVMTDFRAALSFWDCVEGSYAVPSPLGKDDPNAQQASARLKATHQDCLREVERLRDVFTAKLRELRVGLIEEGLDVRNRLKDWRAAGIAEHLYAGEGPEAVSTVFQNVVPQHLGALKTFQAGLHSGGGVLNTGSSISGDVSDYTVSIEATACGSIDGDNDETAYAIRFPDVEMPRAYSFRIDFESPTMLERVVSGAGDADRP
jgi:hypothetical protein